MKDLSLHILDIAHNSIRAKATLIQIGIQIDHKKDSLEISIEDDGEGMTEEQLLKVTDAFCTTRTTRKVGLGIPLLKQKAEDCNGSLLIESTKDKGTILNAHFQYSHIDLPELGGVASVIAGLCCSSAPIRFVYEYKKDDYYFHFDTNEVLEVLDGIAINTPEVELFIEAMIQENCN